MAGREGRPQSFRSSAGAEPATHTALMLRSWAMRDTLLGTALSTSESSTAQALQVWHGCEAQLGRRAPLQLQAQGLPGSMGTLARPQAAWELSSAG